MAMRRAYGSPRLPSVTSLSTTGRTSFAFGYCASTSRTSFCLARRIDCILRVEKPARRDQPRPIVRIHVADEHKILLWQVSEDRREMAVPAPEERRPCEIDDDPPAWVVALCHFLAKVLTGEIAKLLDGFARFPLEKPRLFVQGQSERHYPKGVPFA
jgi:hypothetical protein